MKSYIFSGLLTLAVCTPAFAQENASSPNLIGKRYVETQFSYIDYDASSDFALGSTFNLPLSASFDTGAAFVHTQEEGDDSQNYQVLGAYLTGYRDVGGTRAFARATLNYEWWAVKNLWWYQADVGVERALGDHLLFTAYASWLDFLTDTFLDSSFSGTAKLTYWITPAVAFSGAGTLIEEGNIAYRLGLTLVF
jgi:hypothetical protein